MNRIKLIAGIALLLALLPAGFASASPPINATGTIAFDTLIGGTMYPLGQKCILELDVAHVVAGTIEGSCETHSRITVHGPCTAGPGEYRENWLSHSECTGTVAGSEGTFAFHWVAQVDPDADPNTAGRIVLSGTGDLSNLHGVLHLRGYAGADGAYEGFVHFDPKP